MKKNVLIAAFVAINTMIASPFVFAKNVNIYDQPATNAKVVGTVDLTAGIIPIFTPKNSEWIKVADPRNGNVGWMKSNEMSGNGSSSFTFTQRVLTDDKGEPHAYHVIQYGTPRSMSNAEMETYLAKMKAQQQLIQQSTYKTIQEMMNNLNKLYQEQAEFLKASGFPVLMPVVVVPPNTQPTVKSTNEVKTTTTNTQKK